MREILSDPNIEFYQDPEIDPISDSAALDAQLADHPELLAKIKNTSKGVEEFTDQLELLSLNRDIDGLIALRAQVLEKRWDGFVGFVDYEIKHMKRSKRGRA